jgi:hypothetical protein
MMRRSIRAATLLLTLTLSLPGCASLQQQQVQDTEQLLAAAGFKIRPADTPEKQAHLETLQPFKLVPRSRDNQFVYTYADPQYCKCLYAGGPKAYQELQRLKLQKQQAVAEEMAAENASMNWALWGPPWW